MNSVLRALKRTNAALNDLEAIAGIADIQSLPSHIEIDFSSRCNYRCPMCHQAKLDMGRFQLDRSALDTLIDTLPYVDTVMIAGLGEPLLYPGLAKFLPYLRRYGCRSHLFTNGELIDRHLSLLRNVDRISVSLDGATAETFETLRKGGHFARVVANIRALRHAAPRTRLVTSTVISQRNLHELAGIVQLAADLGMNEVHLSPVDHTPTLALRESDIHRYQTELNTAQRIASGRNVRIFNNIHREHFLPGRNSVISAEDLQQAALPNEWLTDTSFEGPSAEHFIHGMSEQEERRELRERLRDHRMALKKLTNQLRSKRLPLTMPYCSAPWKYGFARSRGDARLCPYADLDVGKVEEAFGKRSYSTPLLTSVRSSMSTGNPCLSVCQGCTDDHRRFRADSLARSLRKYGQPPIRRWLATLGEPLRAYAARLKASQKSLR